MRGMPTVGVEYRYPFIGCSRGAPRPSSRSPKSSFRPNEPNIGKLPNEDAQSLDFRRRNLFRVDKFSGWDRVEGGGRANVGGQYTAQFNHGGTVNMLFGQSYQMFGVNSYAVDRPHQYRHRQRSRYQPAPTTWHVSPINPIRSTT